MLRCMGMDLYQIIAAIGFFGLCVSLGLLLVHEYAGRKNAVKMDLFDKAATPIVLRALSGSLESIELIARLTRENRALSDHNSRMVIENAALRQSVNRDAHKDPDTDSKWGEDAHADFGELDVAATPRGAWTSLQPSRHRHG